MDDNKKDSLRQSIILNPHTGKPDSASDPRLHVALDMAVSAEEGNKNTNTTGTRSAHIITDMVAHGQREIAAQQEYEEQQFKLREIAHLSRPLVEMIQAEAHLHGTDHTNIIYFHQVIEKFPKADEYIQQHHFHDGDQSENILINTVAFDEEPGLIQSLIKDCHFKIVTFARVGAGRAMPTRERAAQLMGKIKGIDPVDAVQELDPEMARALQDFVPEDIG